MASIVASSTRIVLLREVIVACDADAGTACGALTSGKFSKHTHLRISSITSVSTAASNEDTWTSPEQSDDEDQDLCKASPLESSSKLPLHPAPPVRHTFVDFPLERPALRRASSAPAALTLTTVPVVNHLQLPRRRRAAFTPQLLAALGSASLPTKGSLGHNNRRCKPCAFIWKEGGCQNATSCEFCHLCGPDEKKVRRLEKAASRAQRRTARWTQ